VVVQVSDELADYLVGDSGERRRLKTWRGEINDELAEIFAVVGDGMRGRVLYRLEILEVLADSRFHFVPGTAATCAHQV
jgi:hypothetical protein